jgi:ribonuclease BN (tRNA processing enzyme)
VVDFFESGAGETIRITFPDGGLGVVDAHPSTTTGSRPKILDLVDGKRIHFVCLTHPHADHGKDLIPILRDHPDLDSFWHTLSDVSVFVFSGGQIPNYRSPFQEVVREFHAGWGRFLTEIYGHVGKRKLPHRKLRADLESIEIAGVQIHFLSPEESEQNRFTAAYQEIAQGKRKGYPDPNAVSAILALEYGGHVVLLGADALKTNWSQAIEKYRRLRLPKAAIFKVPHHGASNAFDSRKKKPNYLDLASKETFSVLFAGDSNHPDPQVEERLRSKTSLGCLINGKRCQLQGTDPNPLEIELPGAIAVSQDITPCQHQISFAIDAGGSITQTAGHRCDGCSIWKGIGQHSARVKR